MLAGGNTVLRSVHYMVPTDENPERLWAAEHEDINLMTLLIEASGDGLEIKTRDASLASVMCSPDEIVVDTRRYVSAFNERAITCCYTPSCGTH